MRELPKATAAYLQQLASELAQILEDDLVGVYVGGSASLGDLMPESDLDLIAVVSKRLRKIQINQISDRLTYDQLPCPQEGLELFIVKESEVASPSRIPTYEMLLRTGKTWRTTVEKRGYELDLLLDFTICRQSGRKIIDDDPSPSDLFQEIPHHSILRALDQSLDWRLTHLLHPFHDLQGENAVLNACRAWCYKQTGVFHSKSVAGSWAIQHSETASDQRLINQALSIRTGKRKKPLDRKQIRNFVCKVKRDLRASVFHRLFDWLCKNRKFPYK